METRISSRGVSWRNLRRSAACLNAVLLALLCQACLRVGGESNEEGSSFGETTSSSDTSSSTSSATISSGSTTSATVASSSDTSSSSSSSSTVSTTVSATPTPTAAAASPTHLFITGPTGVTAGACTGAFTVTTANSAESAVAATSATTVTLSGASAGAYYSGSDCSSAASQVTVAKDASTATFYFKDTLAESISFIASASGLTSATFARTVQTGSAASLSLTGPSAATAPDCTAFTVALRDAYGNVPTAGSGGVTVNLTGGGSGFYSVVSGCGSTSTSMTITSGLSSGTFYFKDTTPESATLTLASSGLTGTTKSVVVSVGVPSLLAITGGNTSITTGTCSPTFTVLTRDSVGNTSPATGSLNVALGGGSLGTTYSDSRCRVPQATLSYSSGDSARIFYYRNNRIETVTLSASSDGFTAGSYTLSTKSNRKLAVGPGASCALQADGAIRCWGQGFYGQMGKGNTNDMGDTSGEVGVNLPKVNLGTNRTVVEIIVGQDYEGFCAILDTVQVKCWGRGNSGMLGQGDTITRGDGANEMGDCLPAINFGTNRTVASLAIAYFWGCAILDDDKIRCWGINGYGSHGLADAVTRGDGANEMGDSLVAVDLGTGRSARNIYLSYGGVCAKRDDGSLVCWGDANKGLLGTGDTIQRGDQANEMGDRLLGVNLGSGRTLVSLARANGGNCALLDNQKIKCWGANQTSGWGSLLGYGDTIDRGDGANEMGDCLPYVNLGTNRTVTQIFSSDGGYAAILDDGSLKSWGTTANTPMFGIGDNKTRGSAAGEMGDCLPAVNLGTGRTVVDFGAAREHSCARLDDTSIKCWGAASNGAKMGYGDGVVRGIDLSGMGDSLPRMNTWE